MKQTKQKAARSRKGHVTLKAVNERLWIGFYFLSAAT